MQCLLAYNKKKLFSASLYHGRGFHCLSSTIGKDSDLYVEQTSANLTKGFSTWPTKTLSSPCWPGATKSQCAWLSCRPGQWGALVHEGQTTQSSFLVFIGKSYKLVISSSPHRQASLSTFSPVGLLLIPQSLWRLNRRFVGIKSFCKSSHFILARLCKSKSYYLNLAKLCKSNPFIWFQVLSLAVDLYQHCYWEVTISCDM